MNKYVTNLTLPNGTNVLIKDSECRTNLSNEIRRATAKETELKNNINAVTSVANENSSDITTIHSNITAIENKNTEQDNNISTLRTMISSPYNFKGDVNSLSELPETANVNDTYYVKDIKYKVTWTGSAWVQSSLSEADYQTELSELKYDLDKVLIKTANLFNVEKLTKDCYVESNGTLTPYTGWSTSDFIKIEPNTNYIATCKRTDGDVTGDVVPISNVYYTITDEKKVSIDGGSTGSGKFIIKNTTGKYLRFSTLTEYMKNNCMLLTEDYYNSMSDKKYTPYEIPVDREKVEKIENDVFNLNPSNIHSIQRIGDGMKAPHHSVASFIEAYKKGFKILLCDLRFTSDNIPVLFHDRYLNQNYNDVYNAKGHLVSKDLKITISGNTYETLNQYDYGYYKGSAYKGYPLMKLTDMLSLVKKLGVELYIEVKAMTENQSTIACNLVKMYGLTNVVSWCGTAEQMRYVISHIDTARVSTMPEVITDDVIAEVTSLKTGKNKVFIFAYDTTVLTEDVVNKMITNDVGFEFGTLNTKEDIINYFNRGQYYNYCTGIESDTLIADKVLLSSILN